MMTAAALSALLVSPAHAIAQGAPSQAPGAAAPAATAPRGPADGAAPSHEWTHQTLVDASGVLGHLGAWTISGTGSYRTHADHFIFTVKQPSLSESRHRSHAVIGTLKGTHPLGARGTVTAGVEAGRDLVSSTNLGDRSLGRAGVFGEARVAVSSAVQVDLSLRVDRYSEFGSSASPGAPTP